MTGDLTIHRAAVLGATGGTGAAIAHELARRGVATRVVSRSMDNLERAFGDIAVERLPCDVSDARSMRAAIDGCDVVFDCIGLPLDQYARHVETARHLADALRQTRARGVLVSGYWSYAPIRTTPVTENHPRAISGIPGIRTEQEDILAGAGASIALLPDFYGPGASASILNDAIVSILKGKVAMWPGNPDARRDFIYIPDVAAPIVDLATHARAAGERFNVPGSGARPPRELLQVAARMAGTRGRVRAVSRWMVWVGGLFNKQIRQFEQVYPIYAAPAEFDGSKLTSLIGARQITPYETALPQTIEWLRKK